MLFMILNLITLALLGMGMGQASPSNMVNLARDDPSPSLTQIICQPQNFRPARQDFTKENIDYLRGKDDDGPVTLGANTNGKHCSRVSCEYSSAIYACNDNDHDVDVAPGTMADYAQAVLDDSREECNYHDPHYNNGNLDTDVTWGQAFDANGWNIVVGMWHSDGHCP